MIEINLRLKQIYFLLQVMTEVLTTRYCTDLLHVQHEPNSALEVTALATIDNSGLMQCAKQCLLRNKCESFNFNLESGQCQLLDITSNHTTNFVKVRNSVYSEIATWPTTLAGKCDGHVCAPSALCETTATGYTCRCTTPPTVQNEAISIKEGGKTVWGEGEEAQYGCLSSFQANGWRLCQADGSWSTVSCVRITSSCQEVKECNWKYGDGEYWIFLQNASNARVKIYCHGMTTRDPGHFVTLLQESYVHHQCDCRYVNVNYCGKTTFRKVKINLADLELLQSNYTFASNERGALGPLGRVLGCDSTDSTGETCGTLKINFNGTSFAVSPETTWPFSSQVVRSENGSIIDVTCRGRCDICQSYTDGQERVVRLVVSDQTVSDEGSAVLPVCEDTKTMIP